MQLECKLLTVAKDTWMNGKADLRTSSKGPWIYVLSLSTESEFNKGTMGGSTVLRENEVKETIGRLPVDFYNQKGSQV